MRKRQQLPIVLSIAGSDSGGGAGIQTDLKTYFALGVHGCTAITCLTAQNPREVTRVEACSPGMVQAQIQAVLKELPPQAIKTGMLFSAAIIQAVAGTLAGLKCPIIVDPVMIATSGASLLKPDALAAFQRELLPLATLITPNVPEAEALLQTRIRTPEHLRHAARSLQGRFGRAILLKGGHLQGGKEAIDIFFDGETEWLLSAPRIRGVKTHGTGCTYAAAIAAHLARGEKLLQAVELAKEFVSQAIARSARIGRHDVLNLASA